MDGKTYRRGVTFGLDAYLIERQFARTFDMPRIVGYLATCTDGGPYSAGILHGLALGADIQRQQQAAVIDYRYGPLPSLAS